MAFGLQESGSITLIEKFLVEGKSEVSMKVAINYIYLNAPSHNLHISTSVKRLGELLQK